MTKMELQLPTEVRKKIKTALFHAGETEIGGILMGEQIETGRFKVLRASVDIESGTSTTFRRGLSDHSRALDQFFEDTAHDYRRFNYLGEWHSHPRFSTAASGQDVRSMQNVVEREASISSAFLLIVRLRAWMFLDARAYAFARGYLPAAVDLRR